jgi:hypothetical protein
MVAMVCEVVREGNFKKVTLKQKGKREGEI